VWCELKSGKFMTTLSATSLDYGGWGSTVHKILVREEDVNVKEILIRIKVPYSASSRPVRSRTRAEGRVSFEGNSP